MAHIPQDRLLPQDLVDLWEMTAQGPRKVRMHAVDARHAMDVSPEIFMLDLPDPPKPPKKWKDR